MSHLLEGLYQMTGDKQMFPQFLRKLKNIMLLTIDRCRSCASAAIERIIVSNIKRHIAFDSILDDYQHGFRSQRSCETQLVQFSMTL